MEREEVGILVGVVDQISDDPEVQARYEQMVADGTSPRLAEVFATRRFPSLNGTNKAFNRGRCNGNQFKDCPGLGNHFKRIADEAGVSINGKQYMYGLGRFPGDPQAWVHDTSDAIRLAKERNLSLEGIANYRGYTPDPTPDVPLADDIWEEHTQALLAQDPGMRPGDARERVFDQLTGADRKSRKPEPIEGVSIADLDAAFGVTEDDLP